MISEEKLVHWLLIKARNEFALGRVQEEGGLNLTRLGAEVPLPSRGGDFFGVVAGRPAVPPREEGGALPCACIGCFEQGSQDERRYVLASCAWMHANCDSDSQSRKRWRKIHEELRS